ncbi:integrating conjugative element membrane protein, PFL_4697 family [Providencia stuartii]|nr:integrating conjugative element membrane protein, PFL_4697 family [Providencia stuartii]
MATAEVRQETPRHPAKDPGLPAKLLWHWPWAIIGVLLASWVCSLLIEWVGIAFFWADEGGGAQPAGDVNRERVSVRRVYP